MTRNIRLRHVLAIALTVSAVGAWGPVQVNAHASFVGAPATVAAGSEIALTLHVPHERDDTTYNVAVDIRMPPGWGAVECQSKATWTCTIGTESGLAVVRYGKEPGAAPAEDENFDLTAQAGPTPGTASFPTLQTYNTGETVGWIGDPASETPAPNLQVVGTAATTTVPATPTPTNPPPTNPPATPTVAPTTTRPSSPSSTSSTSSAVPATTTSAPDVSLVPTGTEPTGTDSGGGNGGVIAVIVLLLVAAAGSGLYLYLRSRPPTIPPL